MAIVTISRLEACRGEAVAGMVDPYVAPWVIGLGFLIGLCVGLLGAAYPAYRGAQLLPTEALRHE